MRLRDLVRLVKSGGPYIGPKGGLWADPQHTVTWSPDHSNRERNEARIEAAHRHWQRHTESGNASEAKYWHEEMVRHGAVPHSKSAPAPEKPKAALAPALFHSAPAHALVKIKREGLKPRKGAGLYQHGGYAEHSQGKVFLSDNFDAAKAWHGKVEDQLFDQHDDPKKHDAVMLRVKHRETQKDEVGDADVRGSRETRSHIPASEIEFFHARDKAWKPVSEWERGAHGVPESEEQGLRKSAPRLVIPLVGKARKLHKRRMFGGLAISVETRKGAKRHWHDPHSGESGSTTMLHDYGYIRGTMGTDGDHVDVYVGPHEDAAHVYVIDQMKKPGFDRFDEQKVMLGFKSAKAAKKAYLAHYDDPRFFGSMKALPFAEFATKVLATRDSANRMVKGVAGSMAPSHKYKRRWFANGEWQYEYDEPEKTTGRTGAHPIDHDQVRAVTDKLVDAALERGTLKMLRRGKTDAVSVVRADGFGVLAHVYADHPTEGKILVEIAREGGDSDEFSGSYRVYASGRKSVQIVLPSTPKTFDHAKRMIRQVLAHEWTHSVDRSLEAEQRAERASARSKRQSEQAQARDSDDAYRAYRNQRAEVTATLQEIARDLTDKKAVAAARRLAEQYESDPEWEQSPHTAQKIERWAIEHSRGYALAMSPSESHPPIYTPENEKRVRRAIASTFMSILEGKVRSIEKARRHLPLGGLALLLKSGMPKSGGWQPIPGGHKGGWRRWRGGKWEYDYGTHEGGEHKPTHEHTTWKKRDEFSEEDYREGRFDYDPLHWHPREHEGGEHRAWIAGGVNPNSHAPVKTGGVIGKLYQIEKPEVEGSPGYAMLRDLSTGEAALMQHDRIFAVEHNPLKFKTIAKPTAERWDPTKGRAARAATGKGPSFEGSRADKEKQPGLYAIENGAYPLKEITRLEPGTEQKEKRAVSFAVTDHGKTLLVSEFKPLIESTVRKMQRSYGVKDVYERGERGKRATNVTQRELAQAGAEGLLVAVEKYDASVPFASHVKHYVENYIRLACARERVGGITLPDTHARNIAKYLAARAEASKALGTHAPTPEEVLPYFTLLKRHVHPNLDPKEGSKPLPMESYTLTAHEEQDAKERAVIANARRRAVAVKDKETIAKLDEALAKLDDKKMRDTESRPGKRELAELYDAFLTGQGSAADIFDMEDDYAFPGVEVGAGLDPAERVLVRRSTQRVLDGMKDFEVVSEGRKKIAYRADVGEMIAQRLGLRDGEERTTAEIARAVPITANGKPLAARQAQEVVETMIERGLAHVRAQFADQDVTQASLIFGRAADKLTPQPRAEPGPTWTEIVSKRAENVTPAQIEKYRDDERRRLSGIAARIRERAAYEHDARAKERQHALAHETEQAAARVGQLDEGEIRMKIATRLAPETAEMRALATRSVAVEGEYRGYERTTTLMPLTDVRTGRTRLARVRTLRDLRDPEELPTGELGGMRKARSRVTTGMVREALHYPRTMLLLTSPQGLASAPTKARSALERLTLGDFG